MSSANTSFALIRNSAVPVQCWRIRTLASCRAEFVDASVEFAALVNAPDRFAHASVCLMPRLHDAPSMALFGGSGSKLKLRSILAAHARIATRGRKGLREGFAWIHSEGGPAHSRFVAPPPSDVRSLLEDLLVFVNDSKIAPGVRALVAMNQFMNTHPFNDGNGRVARGLFTWCLRRNAALDPAFAGAIDLMFADQGLSLVQRSLEVHRTGTWRVWLDWVAACIAKCRMSSRDWAPA